jgi:histidine triad (HIT) family protein
MNFRMPVMDPCYFCELARGKAGWNVLVEDPLTMTVLNGRQFEPGQSIVFPKRHAPTVLDLSPHEAAAVMLAAQKIAAAITRAHSPEAMLLYQNNGILSGQEVPHFHMHVVPRTPGSDWGVGPPHIARAERADRPAHQDFAIVTDDKLATAAGLRNAIDVSAGSGQPRG